MFEGAFNGFGDVYECGLTINRDGHEQKQRLQAPRMMIETQFANLLAQATQTETPIQITITYDYTLWDQFENKQLPRQNKATFSNNAWVSKYGEPHENN